MRVKSVEECLMDRIVYAGSCIPAVVAEDRRDKFVLLGYPQQVIDETRGHAGLVDKLVRALVACENAVHENQWGSDGDCGIATKVSRTIDSAFAGLDDCELTEEERVSASADVRRTQESADD